MFLKTKWPRTSPYTSYFFLCTKSTDISKQAHKVVSALKQRWFNICPQSTSIQIDSAGICFVINEYHSPWESLLYRLLPDRKKLYLNCRYWARVPNYGSWQRQIQSSFGLSVVTNVSAPVVIQMQRLPLIWLHILTQLDRDSNNHRNKVSTA